MSDAAAAAVPDTAVVPRADGSHIGVMHLGDKVRSFVAADVARLRKVMVDLGMNEFGLDQPTAEKVADGAVDQAAPGVPPETPPEPPPVAEDVEAVPAEGTPPTASDDPVVATPDASDEPPASDAAAAAPEEDTATVAKEDEGNG
jgi:hypothetical protein